MHHSTLSLVCHNICQNGFTALYAASAFGHPLVVEALVKARAKADVPEKEVRMLYIVYCGII